MPLFSFWRHLDLLRSILTHTLRPLQWILFTLLTKAWAIKPIGFFLLLITYLGTLHIQSPYITFCSVIFFFAVILHIFYSQWCFCSDCLPNSCLGLPSYRCPFIFTYTTFCPLANITSPIFLSSEIILFIGFTFSFLKGKVIMMLLHIHSSSFLHYFIGKHPIIFTIAQNEVLIFI